MKKDFFSDVIIHTLEILNNYDLEKFHPVFFEKIKIGWISEKNLSLLKKEFSNLYQKKLIFKNSSKNNEEIFDQIYELLIKKGEIKNLIREKCPVFMNESLNPKLDFKQKELFGQKKIFNVERNILTFFGFPAYGVHCNGWIKKRDSYLMILGKRSDSLKSFPSLYDNLIGGGQPSDLSLLQNLYKEAYEETGLSKKIMEKAAFSSLVKYSHIYNEKFHSSIIAIYDLEINEDLVLKNRDGELSGFEKFEISEIFELVENNKLKLNCIIPIVDFMIKRMDYLFSKSSKNKIKKILYQG